MTRKITLAVANVIAGLADSVQLGNLEAKRDWGYAKDYVRAMWLMLQQNKADDYVIATGETHTIREFCQEAFGCVGLEWEKYVKINKKFYRPVEVNLLLGDYSKAKQALKWEPTVKFSELVKIMVKADLEMLLCRYRNSDKEYGYIRNKLEMLN